MGKCGSSRKVIDDYILRLRSFAYWIPKARDTHSECVICIAFSLQKYLLEPRPIVTVIRSLPAAFLPSVLHYNSTEGSSLGINAV